VIRTDCALVGGDSGGPLFDLGGKVIGIHSRIGGSLASNMHVPVDTYRDTWDKLVAKETVGVNNVYLGIEADAESPGCKITLVKPDSPADKAGLKADDVIKTFNGTKIETLDQLRDQINKRKVGDKVTVEVTRGSETLKLDVTLGKRES
jgi:serine protease Do